MQRTFLVVAVIAAFAFGLFAFRGSSAEQSFDRLAVLETRVAALEIEVATFSKPTEVAPSRTPNVESLGIVDVAKDLTTLGSKVTYGHGNVRSQTLLPVGNELIVDGVSIYIFVYQSEHARVDDLEDQTVSQIALVDTKGRSVITGPLTSIAGRNLLILVPTNSVEIANSVSAVLG